MSIPEDCGDDNNGGIPIQIFIPSHQIEMDNTSSNMDAIGEQVFPETDLSTHNSLASANASLNASLTTPPPIVPSLGRLYRRPSLGDDGGTPPKDLRNPYRLCV